MPRKFLPLFLLAVFTVALAATGPAAAITIDPGLEAALAAKDGHGRVPVILIFGGDYRVEPSVLDEIDRGRPDKRREQVLTALKRRLKDSATGALDVLSNPGSGDDVANLRELYIAGALSFEANAAMVARLGRLPGDGAMFHDNLEASYDAIRADRAPDGTDAKFMPAAIDTAWGVKYIKAHRVWSELGFNGTGVVVGHIDTGVWLAHPDLATRIWNNPGEVVGNGIDDDGNGFIDDWRGWDFGDGDNNPNDDSASAGHGTHTAGTVVGNGTGTVLTGVAPGAKIIPIKVWNSAGTGGSLGTVWAAEQYCVENGARVITMSLGFSGSIPATFMRSERDNCANIRDAGVLLCNSAGNDHNNYDPPIELGLTARVPAPWNPLAVPYSSTGGVLSVGGTGYQNNSAYSSSSWGPAKWNDVDPYNDWPYAPGAGLTKPDVAAPGVNVNSTVIGGGYSGNTWSGTSMSCPHVAGVAALMLQKNASLSPAGLDSLMEQTALDLGAVGKDNIFGSGLVNALLAVQAVPLDQRPDISWTAVMPDPAGDHILDPGQVSPIAFALSNGSQVVIGTNVSATLAVVANPWVTVADGTAAFPDLATGGGAGDNTVDTFSLSVAGGAPQGYGFTMLLTVQADGGFARTFDIDWYVGLPAFRTHDLGGIALTVTDQGIIGYMSDAGVEGQGMSYQGGSSGMFLGSFWAGVDANYVCARDFSGTTPETFEWVVSSSPNGRVRDLGTTGSDQTFQSIFTDAGHALPKPLKVEQTSMTFAMPDNDRFVILEYRLTNNGATALPALYNGVFCDFDINDSAANFGHTDAVRKLTYMYSTGGPYFGIVLLGSTSATSLRLISNTTYVYPLSTIDNGNRNRLMRGTLGVTTAPTAGDWSAITASVANLPANGGQAIVAYALVYGATLTELEEAADAANALYSPVAPVTGDVPVKVLHLAQNHPNPFNPATQIEYVIAGEGHVRLDVFDMAGRRVRTLVDEARSAGSHTAMWDGLDDAGNRAPSGTYFCRMSSGGETSSRKMTMIK
ncbi:MAG: S8 family serine peptidase [bacterium]|nr:S8 family serine peptidase [bacterium]